MHPRHIEKLLSSPKISPEERTALSATQVRQTPQAPQSETYSSVLDAELELYLTRPLPPRHERPADFWPSMKTLVGRLYAVLGFGGVVGYWPEKAESSLSDMLAVLASTKSLLIARKSATAIRDLLGTR